MAFENLSEKLQNVFKSLKSKGRLTEADVKAALKEIHADLILWRWPRALFLYSQR